MKNYHYSAKTRDGAPKHVIELFPKIKFITFPTLMELRHLKMKVGFFHLFQDVFALNILYEQLAGLKLLCVDEA